MNKLVNTRIFIGAGLVLALSACGGGGDSADPIEPIDLTDPSVVGNGTFPNGIWASTSRDTMFLGEDVRLGTPFGGGALITNDILVSYDSFLHGSPDTGVPGDAPFTDSACYHGPQTLNWRQWPMNFEESATFSLVMRGSYDDGLMVDGIPDGTVDETNYLTYVGPITAESIATFHETYSNACDHGDH